MSSHPLAGKRVLALGGALSALTGGPLEGASIEAAALDRLTAGDLAGRDLVLIDANAWEPEPLSAALQALSLRPAPPPVLLVGEHLPTGVVRNLLRLERSDVLEAPFTEEKLLAAVAALLAQPSPAAATPEAAAAPSAAQHARCWAVVGAVGGSGATTVAIEIANALVSRATREKGVCLIDLNLADGASSAYLGANPVMRLAELGAAGAERMDASMLQAFVTPVSPRFDLMAAPRDPTSFDQVGRDAVLRMLETACEVYEWVILDVPRHRRAWTLEALGGCDEVLVISELTVPALLAARSLSDEIDRALNSSGKPKIVLNRLASRMFGPAPNMSEAEKALQRKAEAGISSDWEAAAASVNLGGPIATHRPKSKIVKDVQALVDGLVGHAAPAAGKLFKSKKAA
jgi:pilus assembly protein CpaE